MIRIPLDFRRRCFNSLRGLGFALFSCLSGLHAQSVRISEFMALNGGASLDEDGDASDWVEIHNPTPGNIDLQGWGLSDDPAVPMKWTVPVRTIIRPGGYQVIWASGKNRGTVQNSTSSWIGFGEPWNYESGTANGTNAWQSAGFDDSLWNLGTTPIGRGANLYLETELAEGTEVARFRKSFTVSDPAAWDALELEIASHLGAIVYLNGVEIARLRLPSGELQSNTRATLLPLPGPDLWMAADGPIVLREEGAQNFVSQWTDLSGSNRHLLQGLNSAQPQFIASSAGQKAAIRFDGVDDRLISSAFPTGNALSIFSVARCTGGASFARLYAKGNESRGLMVTRAGTGTGYNLRHDTTAGVNQTRPGNLLFNGTWQSFALHSSASNTRVERNGVREIDTAFLWGEGIANSQPFVLGASYTAASGFLGGDVAELILWNRELSEWERKAVQVYLDEKHFETDTIGSQTLRIPLDSNPGLLTAGTNILAIEIRQRNPVDENFYFDASLKGIRETTILHSGFRLGSSGEPIVLSNAQSEPIDAVPAIPAHADISMGLQPGTTEPWLYYSEPSPGSANMGIPYLGVTDPPNFSATGGFYQQDIELALSAEGGSVIHYSIDGSEPRTSRLGGSTYGYKSSYPRAPGNPFGPLLTGTMTTGIYSSPISIGDRSLEPNKLSQIATWFETAPQAPAGNLRKATVVRARATKPGYLPSRIVTHTYFIGADVMSRYALPVISLASDDDHLFGYERGIYVPGKIADQWREGSPFSNWARWMIPANYGQRGDAWERPVHFEMFTPDGQRVISKNLGARIHGGATREFYRKSFRLYTRPKYDEGSLDFSFFPGLKKRGVPGVPLESFDAILLRNGGNEAAGILFLDALCQGLVQHLPLATQAYQPALHYINGESWGIINIRERIDESYLSDHYGVDPTESIILNNNGVIAHGTAADRQHYYNLVNYAETNNPANSAAWNHIVTQMDVDNHALYYAFQIYIANLDWPENNIDYWRKITPGFQANAPYGHDGRWRWLVYDTEIGFNPANVSLNTLRRIATTGVSGSIAGEHTRLFRALLKNPQYRQLLCNHLADLMNSAFIPTRVNAMIDEFNQRLAPARAEHFQRWQSGSDLSNGAPYKSFAASRPAHVRQHVVSEFALGGTFQLTLATPDDTMGSVQVNQLVISESLPGVPNPSAPYPWTGVYFRGVPVKIKALPKPGHRFIGWAELPGETSVELELNLQADATYTALFEALPPQVTIHEWNFENPASYLEATSSIVPGATLTALPGPSTGYLQSTASQDFTSSHLRVNNPLGASFTWNLPSTGYEDLTLRFLTRRSGQGAGTQSLSYTVDGNNWILLDTYSVADAPPQEKSFDLSSLSAAENNPQFAVRITFSQGTGGSTGNHRFDDFTLEGRPIAGLNQAPEIVGSLAGTHGVAGGDEVIIDLESLFDDPDGDTLSYQVAANPPAMADLEVDGDLLKVTLLKVGDVQLNITAHDLETASAPLVGHVLSYPAPKSLEEGDVIWRSWAANQAAGNFPEHMIFLQGEENDSLLETPMMRAYAIPLADAANPADADFPYAAASRTRINGLGDGGISWINTGRGRDLGAVLLAIDTRGVPTVKVGWTGGTVSPGLRSYAIRLQARIGTHGEFSDVTDGGSPVEYLRSETPGHRQVMMPVSLPPEWLGQPHVQLQWRYHQIGGISGARDMLSLDDIIITTDSGPRAYEAWRLLEFADPSAREDELVSGPAALSNGYPNLLRYALGASRDDDISSRLPSLAEVSGDWHFRFPFDPGKGDIIYRVKSSSDLLDWSETIYDSSTSATAPGSDGFLSLPLGEEGGPERFFRLEIDRP